MTERAKRRKKRKAKPRAEPKERIWQPSPYLRLYRVRREDEPPEPDSDFGWLPPGLREMIDEGWVYSEATDDDSGRIAARLTKGQNRIGIMMGMSTEGGLCAIIAMPELALEKQDERGIWRTIKVIPYPSE